MGITTEGCIRLMALYADMIPGKLESVFVGLENTDSALAAAELKEHMLGPIAALCERAKTL